MRLIDADALLQDNTWEWYDDWGNHTMAGEAVAVAPTIDAVEVVRCKDCKHRDESCGMGEHRWCRILKMTTKPDDYCSYGEREDGEV